MVDDLIGDQKQALSMSVNTFPLEVFDFVVSLSGIMFTPIFRYMAFVKKTQKKVVCTFRINEYVLVKARVLHEMKLYQK